MRVRYLATSCYILFIVLINTLFIYLPGVAAFGQSFSPADMVVGIIYLVRDFAQREIKHYIFLAMIIGGALSYLLADSTVAVASVAAFSVGEIIDWGIYTFTKRPLSDRLIWSAIISSPFDSSVFLYFCQRLHWLPFVIMTLGKMMGVLLLWSYWKFRNRRKVQPDGIIPPQLPESQFE